MAHNILLFRLNRRVRDDHFSIDIDTVDYTKIANTVLYLGAAENDLILAEGFEA